MMAGETNAHIGPLLAKQRESLKLSLDAVHKRTRIAPHFLEALEKEQFEVFPAEVYLIGFLRQYAKFLGLDPDQIVKMFQDLRQQSKITAPETTGSREIPPTVPHSVHTGSKSHSTWLLLPLLIILAALVWSLLASRAKHSETIPPQPVAVSTTAVSGTFGEAGPPAVSQQKGVLEAVARVSSWLRVRADGQMVFEGILPQGARQQWQAAREFVVRSGYVEGVSLTLNGLPVDLATGAKNHVNEITLKAQGT